MRLSVVIPAWCEALQIGPAVRSAHRIGDEVVVVDAGSPDETAHIAARAGARVVQAAKGRGAQLRAGADAARGDVLLFLHADARLPPVARDAIETALARPEVPGGSFRVRFVPAVGWARVFSALDDWRRRVLHVFYGDAGLFVRRDVYEGLGGFRPWPVLEDYDLARRLGRIGSLAYVRDVAVRVSSRRFRRAPLRTVLVWVLVQSLFLAGLPPRTLARLYADAR